MANSLEYTLNCQVCFEEFEETGDHVPRLLPCTHTLCETCVGQLIKGGTLECPECRQRHSATREGQSFPQNKYMLVNIKRRPTSKIELCERHNRQKSLFCMEDCCQKLICPLCLKNEHRSHDFEEAQQIFEEKRKVLMEHIESLKESLVSNKERLLVAKAGVEKNIHECTEKIHSTKEHQIRTVVDWMTELYDNMTDHLRNCFREFDTQINKESVEIEGNLELLADIKEDSKGINSIEYLMEVMATIDTLVIHNEKFASAGKFKTFEFHESKLTLDDVRTLVGTLDSNDDLAGDLKPMQKLTLLPATPNLKTIQNASCLELKGKYYR